MAGPDVYIVRTGLANLASVAAGIVRAGATPHITESPRDVERASHVILPGVGAFGAAMEHLHRCGLVEPLRRRAAQGRPLACVCVGSQLLARDSEESPGVEGLGIVPCSVLRFPATVRVPQLGWNRIVPEGEHRLIEEGYAYFANSYCLKEPPPGWSVAYSEHGHRFIAAMEKGALLGCQFHPELSGPYGLRVIEKWLSIQDQEEAAC